MTLPVQTAECAERFVGTLIIEVVSQLSESGS